MFSDCMSLVSLDLSNFYTINVKYMSSMFSNCISLESLNLGNFETGNVFWMDSMFYNCTSLISLDLNNFRFISVRTSAYMFYNCKNLEFLNIYNFETFDDGYYTDMFFGTSDYLIYCMKDNIEDTNQVKIQLLSKNCSVLDCSSDWKSKKKNLFQI